MHKMPIAVQVYSIREDAGADFKGTMEQISKMGYDGVELAGMYGMKPEEIKEILDTLGLQAISAHVPYDEFAKDMKGTIGAYKTLGCSFLAIPWLPVDQLYGGNRYEETISFIKDLSAEVKEQGMELVYHNHGFEFEKTNKGSYVLDELYQALAPEQLGVELDTCWARVAGVDPAAYLRAYAGRCPILHVKDYVTKEEVELMPLGEGEMDIPAVIRAAAEIGSKWLVIEQDDHSTGSPMENMAKSIRYLKDLIK